MVFGANGLKAGPVQWTVEVEWKPGRGSATAQPRHMEEKSVLGRGKTQCHATPRNVQVINLHLIVNHINRRSTKMLSNDHQ